MKEILFGLFAVLFISGIIPMGLMVLAETHKIIFWIIASPILLSFGKEVITDVLENYNN